MPAQLQQLARGSKPSLAYLASIGGGGMQLTHMKSRISAPKIAPGASRTAVAPLPSSRRNLLRSLEGHSAPPMLRGVRWYGHTTLATMSHGDDATALQLLSAGGDKAVSVVSRSAPTRSLHPTAPRARV